MKIGEIPVSKRSEALKERNANWLSELFDIPSCHCLTLDLCNCPREFKVNLREWPFLIDQRGARLMVIGNIDPIVTKLMRNVRKANTETSIRVENEGKRLKLIQVAHEVVEYSDTELSEEIVESNDPTISLNNELESSNLGNSHFPRNMRNTIQAADTRYGISDRALADILNNFLIDLDIVNETDQSMIIDRNKIRIHRHKERQLSIRYTKNENFQNISSLYFDGRIDKHTKVELQSEGQVHYEIHP